MSDWQTSEPSLCRKILVLLGLSASLSAMLWFGSSLNNSSGLASHIGFFCAELCVLGCLMFFWSAICAYFVRRWRWSPKSCFIAGLPFLVCGLLLLLFAHAARVQQFGAFVISGNWITVGYVCRRLAFPQLTDEQAAAPTPPLSLFPQ